MNSENSNTKQEFLDEEKLLDKKIQELLEKRDLADSALRKILLYMESQQSHLNNMDEIPNVEFSKLIDEKLKNKNEN